MTEPQQNEFSRPVSPDGIGEEGKTLSIEADAAERARLAERLGLDGLEALRAEIRLTPRKGGRMVLLEGTFRADVRQTCVVTLEPVEDHIEGTLERLYDTTLEGVENKEQTIDMENEEPPDPLTGGVIDAGEAVAEQLALEINPFPRKKGTEFAEISSAPDAGDKGKTGEVAGPAANPFAELEKLKDKLKK